MWCCWISPDDNPVSTPASAVVETGLILWLDILHPTFRNYASAFPIKAPSFASGYSFTEP